MFPLSLFLQTLKYFANKKANDIEISVVNDIFIYRANKGAGIKKTLIIAVGIFVLSISLAWALRVPRIFSFNTQVELSEWEEKIFQGRVLYVVKKEKKNGYLVAFSRRAASGIFHRLVFNPVRDPMVSWKWKVVEFPQKQRDIAGSTWIEQDDYAARFYVIFPSLFFTRMKSLEYVWDLDLPEGTVLTSPYSENIKIIVAESGKANLGKWVFEERNVYEDFKMAFGRPPGKVGAIAIMTDADNTISNAEAHYDEIKVGYRNDEE